MCSLFLCLAVDILFSKKMSYKDYNIELTIKAILMFEKLSGHSYMAMKEEDMVMFLYCVFVTSNKLVLTYSGFQFMMEDKKFAG